MERNFGSWSLSAAHLLLICQQAGGYTYRNQRKFSEDIDWSYAGTLNQKNWAKKFPLCSSAKQSPINIDENMAPVKSQYQKLRFDGWESSTTDRTTIKNDGKTVAVNVDGDFYVSGGGSRSKFKVGRITFHWGRCNASLEGSEHSSDGVKYPLEMQIYCYEAHQFDSLDEAIQARGRITALAVLFETSTEDNMNYAAIIDGIDRVSRYGKTAEVSPFTSQGLSPNSTEKYFIYNGSLTTPPCTETVEWILFKNQVAISDEQSEMFCEVMTMQQAGYVMSMDYSQNNYRDQQEEFMGQVFSSYTGIEEVQTPVCSSEPESLQAAPQNLSSSSVVWERPRAVYDANIEKYSLTYRSAGAEDSASSEYSTDGYQDTGAILDDLLPNSTYEVRVVAICSNGSRGRVSHLSTVVMPVADAENIMVPGSDETEFEDNYEPDSSWNEVDQFENNLDWRIPNSPRSTTSAPPWFPSPGIRTPSEKSSEKRTTTEPAPASIFSQSAEVLGASEELEASSTPLQPPEDATLPESRGRAGVGGNTSLFFTTEKPLISTSTTALLTYAKTEGVNEGVAGEDSSETGKGHPSTTNSIASDRKTKDTELIFQSSAITTTESSPSTDMSSTSSSSSSFFKQAEANQGLAQPINEDGITDENVSFPEVHISSSTARILTSTEAIQHRVASSSMPHFSSTASSVMSSGIVVQATQSSSNGERSSVSPSSSSASYPVCDTLEPSAALTRLHDPSSSWPVSSAPAPESQHATTGLSSSKDSASASIPFLSASTSPHPPHPSHSSSAPTTDSVFFDVSFENSDNDFVLSGSSGDLVTLMNTPPSETVLDLTHTSVTTESSKSSLDFSSLTFSLSFSPTSEPSVLFSSDFPFSVVTSGPSKSLTTGFEDSKYATGSTTESLGPEVSGDGLLLASDMDILCGCSSETSASSSWLHASPHVASPSSAKTSSDLELYSSLVLLSTSGGDVENLPTSLRGLGSAGPSFVHSLQSHSASSSSSSSLQFLQPTHSDLHLSVTATLSVGTDSELSTPEGSTTFQTSPPNPPTKSPFTPPPEEQLLDFTGSTSGSAFLPDQEWDRGQTSASGVSPLPHSTKVASTVSPFMISESGQSPEDVEEHSSTFYFESGSGSAMGPETKLAPTVLEATLDSPWSLGEAEVSGSGQGEGLSDNETSSDFSISEHTESEEEEPVSDASNSSHESRVGSMSEKERKAVIPSAVISTLTSLGSSVLLGIFIYWRMCFQTAHFYINNVPSRQVITQSTAAVTSDEDAAFAVKDFIKHVAELHSTQGFQPEFETLKESYEEVQSCTVNMWMTTESSSHPNNKKKNRYNNILAYDHSRVQLSPQANKDGKTTDYINANYVDGYKKPRSYIAAQGPSRSSTEDFWRMIWEQNVHIIVMITNSVENGRRKCDQYWPSEVQEEYGRYLVTVKSTKVSAFYTQRTFSVRNTLVKKSPKKGWSNARIVTQYQYTQWPDMGVPELSSPLLSFVRKSSKARTNNMGPIVVHCSAGVGRTGTYIVSDSMLKQIKEEGTVNITGFSKQIRTQRNYSVQTEEQYVFIHDALVEAILCGDTEVEATHSHSYVDESSTSGGSGKTCLDKQFELVCDTEVKKGDFSTASQDNHSSKNRDGSVIPAERSRVRSSTTPGETSDYINASYISGYRLNKEFIITQNPLPSTIKDFWRMIWDHNTQVIISSPGTHEEAELGAFWPGNEQSFSFKMFAVTQKSEAHICSSNEDMSVVREYTSTAAKDDFVSEVKHFLATCWPNPDSPISNTFEFISSVNEERASKDCPTVVHDDVGGVTAGMFCASSSSKQQSEAEGSADVFQAARSTNLLRPGVFSDVEDYQFLYKAMSSIVGTQEAEKSFSFSDNNGTTADSFQSSV